MPTTAGYYACLLRFYYHLNGDHIGRLSVKTRQCIGCSESVAWTRNTSAGDQWIRHGIYLRSSKPFQVRRKAWIHLLFVLKSSIFLLLNIVFYYYLYIIANPSFFQIFHILDINLTYKIHTTTLPRPDGLLLVSQPFNMKWLILKSDH